MCFFQPSRLLTGLLGLIKSSRNSELGAHQCGRRRHRERFLRGVSVGFMLMIWMEHEYSRSSMTVRVGVRLKRSGKSNHEAVIPQSK